MVCALLGFSTAIQAQQKIAHVKSDEIILEMSEYKQAKSEVEAYSKILQKQLEGEQAKLQEYYADVNKKLQAGILPPVEQQEAEATLAKMQQDLQVQASEADQKLAVKEQELTKPLYDKFNVALQAVAKANNLAYIFDIKLALYSGGGQDVSDLVRKELGL